ncbi:PREDICTED: embryo defective [Prunus dulcis]|uniref:PREDICTED: embryo defective n=1 Tax=Prunus dulcis TaxID=3755 RepID=A0A5E4EHY2_PRUDU|nr:uncharacterized protein LOC117636738 [Prunus dulcis]VVA15254.1 PREDICTED: embryo defective [Prunus dulcis]
MATLYPSYLLSASPHLQASAKINLRAHAPPSVLGPKGLAQCSKLHAFGQSVKLSGLRQNSQHNISCAINMTAGQSDEPGKMKFDHLINKARKLWESSPQPVKIFPWKRAVQNFIQLIFDLILAVVKYLSVPLLAVSSLSEMSYCAHAKKLFLVPIPVLIGMAIAEVLKLAALDASPLLKDAEVPWHLIGMAIFFTLLKLPGPYYPFWGRILIPHLANGGLLRTLWFAFLWYRRPQRVLRMAPSQNSESGSQSEVEPNKL